jgi:hypothetical protein
LTVTVAPSTVAAASLKTSPWRIVVAPVGAGAEGETVAAAVVSGEGLEVPPAEGVPAVELAEGVADAAVAAGLPAIAGEAVPVLPNGGCVPALGQPASMVTLSDPAMTGRICDRTRDMAGSPLAPLTLSVVVVLYLLDYIEGRDGFVALVNFHQPSAIRLKVIFPNTGNKLTGMEVDAVANFQFLELRRLVPLHRVPDVIYTNIITSSSSPIKM